jgi:hypothetical protein
MPRARVIPKNIFEIFCGVAKSMQLIESMTTSDPAAALYGGPAGAAGT